MGTPSSGNLLLINNSKLIEVNQKRKEVRKEEKMHVHSSISLDLNGMKPTAS